MLLTYHLYQSIAHKSIHIYIYDNQCYSQVILVHSFIASDPVHDPFLLVIHNTMQISLICHANEMPCKEEILSLNPCNFISASPSSLNIFQSFHSFKQSEILQGHTRHINEQFSCLTLLLNLPITCSNS